MQLNSSFAIKDLCKTFPSLKIHGEDDKIVDKIALVHFASNDEITFVDSEKWLKRALKKSISVIILTARLFNHLDYYQKEGRTFIIAKEPIILFSHIIEEYTNESNIAHFQGETNLSRFENCNIDKSSWIAKNAKIGKNTIVYPNVFIGNNCKIGENCKIYPNACIMDDSSIGYNTTIKSNSTIGGDPFSIFKLSSGEYYKLPIRGSVSIGNNCSIGSSVCIDRGILEVTKIGNYVYIDNLVQIAHGVSIGNECTIISQSGIAGQTQLGNNVLVEGQAGITQNLFVASGAIIHGKSVVSRSIYKPGEYIGIRARHVKKELARQVALSQLVKLPISNIKELLGIHADIDRDLKSKIKEHLGLDKESIDDNDSLVDDLDADSLDTLEIIMAIQEDYNINISDEEIKTINTYKDVYRIVANKLIGKNQ